MGFLLKFPKFYETCDAISQKGPCPFSWALARRRSPFLVLPIPQTPEDLFLPTDKKSLPECEFAEIMIEEFALMKNTYSQFVFLMKVIPHFDL